MNTKTMRILGTLCVLLIGADAYGRGFRGGGGRGGGGGISRGGGGGGFSRGGGGARPNMGASRPSISRPQSRPSAPNLGASRPNISRPSPSFNRPSVSRPSNPISRPSGGFKPSTPSRPQVINQRPTTLPGNTRPNLPNIGGGSKPNLPNIGGGNRPNLPNIGGGSKPNLPNVGGGNRPSLPNLGGGGSKPNLPNVGGGNRPDLPNVGGGNRPNLPNIGGGSKPNFPNAGGGNRPSPGNVGNFLGMDRPLKPDNRPGVTNWPSKGGIGNNTNLGNSVGNNSNIGNRIGSTNIGNRVNADFSRPINIGSINAGNRVVNNRPSWANINNSQRNLINNRWQSQLGGMRNWQTRYPARNAYWNGWANGVRGHYGNYHRYGWFNNDWWGGHRHPLCGWHYGYAFNRYPSRYWWTIPTYAGLTNWFTWNAPAAVWTEPVYYDYGTGGNVVYQDNSVYVNNQPVATAAEFAESAAALATVEPPANDQAAAEAEWMPLGTFAVSTSEKDVNPNRVIQLAVDRQGIISGTLYNTETDEAQSVQGQVDKDTQRVAFRIGESENVIVETGLYDLTQQEAPALVHFGTDKVENYLLVRLDPPEDDSQTPAQQ